MPRRTPRPSAVPVSVAMLPDRPSLEFERKRAKHLLRDLRAGTPDALARARQHSLVGKRLPADLKLADAQLMIAREYGFSSWPRLVEYFETLERHTAARPDRGVSPRSHHDLKVEALIEAHRERRTPRLASLAAFVPRFYGLNNEEILASTLSVEEAQLTVARQARFPSWQALLEQAERGHPTSEEFRQTPTGKAIAAVNAQDREALTRLLKDHPSLLAASGQFPVVRTALLLESKNKPEARAMTDWLAVRGADVGAALNGMLLDGFARVKTEHIAFLLERGADPSWVPPSGISVLEQALLMYWNPEAVDLIASHVKPPRAFWVSAGLGDVPATLSYLDKKGRPIGAARRNRPDLVAVGLGGPPARPDAPDIDIVWEAFLVAGFNQRLEVLDALLDRGFPIDYDQWGMSLLEWAQGNRIASVAEHLLSRGAKPKES